MKVALVLVLHLDQARGSHGRIWYPVCLEFVEAYSWFLYLRLLKLAEAHFRLVVIDFKQRRWIHASLREACRSAQGVG